MKNVATGGNTTTSTTISVAVPAGGVAAGDTLIITFAMDPTAGTVSCGDSKGNAYTKDADITIGAGTAGVRTVVCSGPITASLTAGDTIAVTYPAVAAKAISVNEFAGVGAFDRTASTTGSNTTPSSGFTAATLQADELLIGAIGVETDSTELFSPEVTQTGLPPGSSSGAGGATNVTIDPEFRIVAAKGSYAAAPTIAVSRLWAAAVATYRATCGNGVVDAGEVCDKAAANSACCTATCQFEVASTVCRAAAGACDAAETCTGASASCPADGFQPAATLCRAATDVCDAAETCTGASAICPADALQAAGTSCRPATDACDAPETCTGLGAACPTDGVQPAGTICRAAANTCDVAETCTGAGAACPPDGANPSCTGPGPGITFIKNVGTGGNTTTSTTTSITVPAAGVAAGNTLIITFVMDPTAGTVSCGDSRGNAYTKDADLTNGAGTAGVRTVVFSAPITTALAGGDIVTATYPSVAAKAISVNEFAGVGAFDRTASTTGSNTTPSSGFTAATNQADELLIGAIGVETDATDGFAAGAGYVALPPGSSSAAGGATNVTVRPEFRVVAAKGSFTAGGTITPTRLWAAAVATYRATCGNGVVDAGEVCDKAAANSACCTATCQFEVASTVCRAAAGACDAAETCTGASASCPADGFQPAATLCRAATDVCDAAETCTGASAICPADVLQAAGTSCRPATDACDAPETCTGLVATCPTDGVQPAGTICRAAANTCDVAETCTGAGAACPPDGANPSCTGPGPGIAFIKNVGTGGNTTTSTTTSITVPAAGVAAGNTLIITFVMDPTAGTVSCGDSRGNAYTKDADITNGAGTAGVRTVVFSAPITTALAGGDIVTATYPSVAAKAISVNEFAGIGLIDRTASTTGSNTTPSSGFTAATNQADELLIGAIGVETLFTDPFAEGAGYTALPAGSSGSTGSSTSNVTTHPEFRIVSANGSYAAAGTINPSRLWAAAIVAYRAKCGNGIVDPGEPCDKGAANSACCSATCQFEVAATACRAATDACDAAETCTGVSAACPADALQPAGTVCRAVADLCDAPETCSGASAACPADTFQPAGAVCRAASDLCNAAETCSGASAACPADVLEPAGTVCRALADTCDVVETCTGAGAACPPDGSNPSCTGPGPGITFIKNVGTSGNTTLGTSLSITVPAAGVAAGDTLVVTLAMDPTTGPVSCGDSQGNVYTKDADLTNGAGTAGVRTVVFSGPIATALAAGDTVTVSFPTVAAKAVSVDEFAGLVLDGALDQTATASGASTTPSSGFSAATTQAAELLVGAIGVESETTHPFAAAAGYTALVPGSSGLAVGPGGNVTIHPAFRVVSAKGSYAAGGTIGSPSAWAAALVTYRAPAGSGPTATPTAASTGTPTGTETPGSTLTPTPTPGASQSSTPATVPTPSATATPLAFVVDAFHCFEAKTSAGTAKFIPHLGVHLVDDFEDVVVDVPKPLSLCAPTDTDGSGIVDAATHLERYQAKPEKGTPMHIRRTGLRVENQLGTIFLDTVKPDSLMVPTAMDPAVSPPPPDPQQHQVDHYKCYAVKTTKGTPSFPKEVQVSTAGDPFTTPARLYLVRKPTRLCAPVDKNGEGRRNPDHLLCYQVKLTSGRCMDGAPVNAGGGCTKEGDCGGTRGATSLCVSQDKFAAVPAVRAANQFGAEDLDVVRENEICLPSLRIP